MSRAWPAAVMVAAMSLPVWSASSRSLNEQGNEAYRRIRYDDALRSYTEAQVDSPNSPIIEYNIAIIDLERAKGTLLRYHNVTVDSPE